MGSEKKAQEIAQAVRGWRFRSRRFLFFLIAYIFTRILKIILDKFNQRTTPNAAISTPDISQDNSSTGRSTPLSRESNQRTNPNAAISTPDISQENSSTGRREPLSTESSDQRTTLNASIPTSESSQENSSTGRSASLSTESNQRTNPSASIPTPDISQENSSTGRSTPLSTESNQRTTLNAAISTPDISQENSSTGRRASPSPESSDEKSNWVKGDIIEYMGKPESTNYFFVVRKEYMFLTYEEGKQFVNCAEVEKGYPLKSKTENFEFIRRSELDHTDNEFEKGNKVKLLVVVYGDDNGEVMTMGSEGTVESVGGEDCEVYFGGKKVKVHKWKLAKLDTEENQNL